MSESHPLGLPSEGRQRRPRLEHPLLGSSGGEEVVGQPHAVEPMFLGGPSIGDHVFPFGVELGQDQAEFHGHPFIDRHRSRCPRGRGAAGAARTRHRTGDSRESRRSPIAERKRDHRDLLICSPLLS